eukprot:Clim_evm19s34 gene=Clim_evmTU19s34
MAILTTSTAMKVGASLGGLLFVLKVFGNWYPWASAPHRYVRTRTLDPTYQRVVQLFEKRIERGEDLGATVCVYKDGKKVVDVAGGSKGRKPDASEYSHETLQLLFSTTKFMESVCIAIAVDRGYLRYEEPICKYWPEFAQNGKENITVADLMRHEACLNRLDPITEARDLWIENHEEFGAKLAQVKPYVPYFMKSKLAYHAVSRGLFASYLLSRVDPKGRSMGEFMRDEVCEPLGLDIHLGTMPEKDYQRVARMTLKPAWYTLLHVIPQIFMPSWMARLIYNFNVVPDLDKSAVRRILFPFTHIHKAIMEPFPLPVKSLVNFVGHFHGEDWFKVNSASGHGFGNASSVARLAQCIANGGELDGVRILSKETLERCNQHEGPKFCDVMRGYFTFTDAGWAYFEEGNNETGIMGYGWMGMGGSYVIFIPELNMSFSYVMNSFGLGVVGEYRGKDLLWLAIEAARSVQAPTKGLSNRRV